ncbi:fructosamine kinase family protein [Nafulsella turpanensis]|uniref:fructosamine kinase family protein n=1 Tax=Nafulsella turpanensis TaxID=1265690 RepID=UPI00034809ED|nr:fructosamine kinase family protein [Nafulsella turpanensis]
MLGDNNSFFEQVLFESTGSQLGVEEVQLKTGGCINNAVQLKTAGGSFFLKWNEAVEEEMFAAEARGLQLLRSNGSFRIPEVLGMGKVSGKSYLLLEYIDSRHPAGNYWEELGRSLARMHTATSGQYGLDHANFIGRLPQNNEQSNSWIDFFRDSRLQVQLGLALYNKRVDEAFARRFKSLYPRLSELLTEEPPALLHGDLWSGNVMVDEQGQPSLIDPAVFYGHREAELAFTELFGGFDERFYNAYQEAKPLEPGYEERKDIYNLYPLMVHVNLFGTSYLSGVERTLNRYL